MLGTLEKESCDLRVGVREVSIDQLAKDKESGVSEDHAKGSKSEVETLTKNHIKTIDQHTEKKVGEVEEL